MKILLVAVNAKYTHMNPALYSIKAFAGLAGAQMEIAEYTINQYPKDVLMDIFEKHPQVIGFSCYIWNMAFIGRLLEDIGKIMPDTLILLGGPEVAFNRSEVLEKYPAADGVFFGDGEEAWKELVENLSKYENSLSQNVDLKKKGSLKKDIKDMPQIPGLELRGQESLAKCPELTDLDDIPFIFDDLSPFRNRMLYYETSRGCPFACSYCLSSIDKKMRFRSLEKVYPELQFFLDGKVQIVKFIDRTFNADRNHALGIWKYLAEHDNGVTRFHFEIEADILSDGELEFLSTVRPGLFQFEVGVQSTNPDTLKAINRNAKLDRIKANVLKLKSFGNIPVHVDLIAGLPFEDFGCFRNSFNEVYSWGADELQLGFLKVLHGTEMEKKAAQYEIKYESSPTYEVLSTKWLSYSDIIRLKAVEEQLDRYGNSGAFRYTMPVFEQYFSDAFAMYEYIADYYSENAGRFSKQSRLSTYEMLKDAIEEKLHTLEIIFGGWDIGGAGLQQFDALLLLDLYAKEKLKTRPEFIDGWEDQRRLERDYIKQNSIKENIHAEFFDFDVWKFIHDDEIIKQEANSCVMIFSYSGQGAAAAIEIKNLQTGKSDSLKKPVGYDIN